MIVFLHMQHVGFGASWQMLVVRPWLLYSAKRQLLEPQLGLRLHSVGTHDTARALLSCFTPSGSRFHAATQDARSCSTRALCMAK